MHHYRATLASAICFASADDRVSSHTSGAPPLPSTVPYIVASGTCLTSYASSSNVDHYATWVDDVPCDSLLHKGM